MDAAGRRTSTTRAAQRGRVDRPRAGPRPREPLAARLHPRGVARRSSGSRQQTAQAGAAGGHDADRPRGRARPSFTVLVDSHERYAYRFAGQQVDPRRSALSRPGTTRSRSTVQVIAAVERKSLPELVSTCRPTASCASPRRASALPRAAVVVEERCRGLQARSTSRPRWSRTRSPSCRCASRRCRVLRRDAVAGRGWTLRWLAGAMAEQPGSRRNRTPARAGQGRRPASARPRADPVVRRSADPAGLQGETRRGPRVGRRPGAAVSGPGRLRPENRGSVRAVHPPQP